MLHLYSASPGADRGDREGGAQAAVALRRAAGAVLPARSGAARGAGRARDRDRGRHGRRARRTCAPTGRRSARPRGDATRYCGCATPRRPTRPPTTCSAATSRSSTARSRWTATASCDGAAGLATALAFRLKLALAAGFAPELASCARCGEADELAGFSGAAGGVVCAACERGGFELSPEAHAFMVEALGRPLAQAPPARRARPAPGRAGDHRDARASRARAAAAGRLAPLRLEHSGSPPWHAPIRQDRRMAEQRRDDLLEALGGPQGIADSSLPALAFVIAYTVERQRPVAGRWVAVGAGAADDRRSAGSPRDAAVRARRASPGVALSAFIADRTGQAEDFFLPGLAAQRRLRRRPT